MKKIYLFILFVISLFVYSNSVYAKVVSHSSNYSNCGDASYQCVTCRYKSGNTVVNYDVAADGKGGGSVSWSIVDTDDNDGAPRKAVDSNYSEFCKKENGKCVSLECPGKIYASPSATDGSVVFDTAKNNSNQYAYEVGLTLSDSNNKSFISEEVKKEIETGTKYSPNTCYYNNNTFGNHSGADVSSNRDIAISMDADGKFTMTYGGEKMSGNSANNISNVIDKNSFSKNCPKLYFSCQGSTSDSHFSTGDSGIICSVSTEEPLGGGSGEGTTNKDGSNYVEPEVDPYKEYDNGDVGFLQICNPTENKEFVAAFRMIGIIVNIIKILVPIIMIILGMIDMSKAVTDGNADAIKKSSISILKRAFAGILIFFAPTLINEIFHMVDGWDNVEDKFSVCMDCLTGSSDCPNVKFGDEYRWEE